MNNNCNEYFKYFLTGGIYFLLILQWIYMLADLTGTITLLLGVPPEILPYFYSVLIIFSVFTFYFIGKFLIERLNKLTFFSLASGLVLVWLMKYFLNGIYHKLLSTYFQDLAQAKVWLEFNATMGIPIVITSILFCVMVLTFPFTKYFKT